MTRFNGALLGGLLAALLGLRVAADTQAPAAAPRAAAPRPVASHEPARVGLPRPAARHGAALTAAQQTALVQEYCATCHSDKGKAGGLSLASFDAAAAPRHAETSEKIIRKLRAGMMPPAGARRPDAPVLAALAASLEARMDAAAAGAPRPGWRPFQRLNRAEYAREVRDLVGLDVDVAAFLPPDTISNGFDNVADTQAFSPALMEGYLRAASRVTALAIGDPDSAPTEASYKLPKTASQLQRAEGAPVGTRGGTSTLHTFPADGEYVFRLEFYAEPLGILYGSTAKGEQIEVSIDGARVALLDVNPRMSEQTTGLAIKTPAIHVTAGTHRVTAAFINRFEGPLNDLIAPIEHTMADTEIGLAHGITTLPHLRSLNIVGPHRVTGVSETPSRRRIFTCRPTAADEEAGCARQIVARLAGRAFRRAASAKEVDRLLQFYDEGRKEGNFEQGIASALEAILASPQFLMRLESAPAGGRPGAPYLLADVELASRLSFFLWGTGPDEALLAAARAGTLRQPGAAQKQIARMLADPRAEALATRFASQWLRLQDLDKVSPDPILYPYYDATLADGLRRETELFFESLVREDRSVLDLLTADFTFVNERVARHYGIPGVSGPQFRRVTLPPYRRGILGQGSILTLTSNPDRTSPVMRGKWVLEVLLGSPPPPPPPNVPDLAETKAAVDGRVLSVRQRMEEHRRNPACTNCHKVIDPLGLALENFDPTGRWRIKDGEYEVDATGDLYDGTKMAGPDGLRQALLKHKDALLLSFTESLMTYALGRRVEAADMPAVRQILKGAAARGYRISAFIQGVTDTPAFRMSTPGTPPLTTTAARQERH